MLEGRIETGEVDPTAKLPLEPERPCRDRVEIDGKKFVVISDNTEHAQVIVYNKPEGVMTTHCARIRTPDRIRASSKIEGRTLDRGGRLDINTTGLLLLTTGRVSPTP
ncbi:hypothetical protein [Dokdonella sp.]|uniref:hypothetical protein n=1 Tax=Dokdonella sp. TaxID=2291710 RepID=UPI00352901FF